MALSKRTIKSMATKERIRNVALNLMHSQSIDQISVQDICTMANVGVGTFYHHYKAKDDIVREAYFDMDAHFLKLAEEAKLMNFDPYEYVQRHFICYTSFLTEVTVDFARKVFSMQSKVFLDNSRPIYTTIKSFLKEKQMNGDVAKELDIDNFCTYVSICLRGLAYDWCLHEGQYDLSRRCMEYADNVLSGYRKMLGVN